MLQYIPANAQTPGIESNDKDRFAIHNFEIDKSDFDAILLDNGFNEADIESLGYAEIVKRINADL